MSSCKSTCSFHNFTVRSYNCRIFSKNENDEILSGSFALAADLYESDINSAQRKKTTSPGFKLRKGL